MQRAGANLPRAADQRIADPPWDAHQASTPVSTTLVGIGVPSKYLTLPVPSAIDSAVTLNRARRLTPQQTK
jgi:hypothetical protein